MTDLYGNTFTLRRSRTEKPSKINNVECFEVFLLCNSRCYLCGKDTPMGTSNVLLHLKHHHPKEHTTIVHQLARKKNKTAAEPSFNLASSSYNTVIKTEPLEIEGEEGQVNIKLEVEEG